MTDGSLASFPAHAGGRSIHLSGIEWQTEKTEVARLLVDVGIRRNYFRLYWDTRTPPRGHHTGYCFVEFWSRELAVLAWSRLNGLRKWGRVLVVRPVTKPGSLEPSLDELNAARSQHPVSSANRLLEPHRLRPRGKLHQISSYTTRRVPKNYGPISRTSIPPRARLPRRWTSTGRLTGDAPEGSSAKADNTSHKTAHKTAPKTAPKTARKTSRKTSRKPSTNAVKDIWSDGSLREKIQRNADKVGPGWGGYRPFQVNPLRGPIDPSEVQALNWHDPTPFRYIDVDGDIVLHVSAALANKKEDRTESLWFVLAKASGEMTDEKLREREKTLPSPRDAAL